MGKRKTAAQIRRMERRAAARGEEYERIEDGKVVTAEERSCQPSPEDTKLEAARKLTHALDNIEKSEDMNAKERRAAKRKAEAIAVQEASNDLRDGDTAPSAAELLELLKNSDKKMKKSKEKESSSNKRKRGEDDGNEEQTQKKTPYVAFVGQLSYTSTIESIQKHFENGLGRKEATEGNMKIRLLTHKDSGKSRGMAFVEVDSPELLHECFKMHQTYLDGRRINVERTAGGSSNEKKTAKLEHFREEHKKFISDTVERIFMEYQENGDLDEGELDGSVISLCKRHSMPTVEASLKEYLESKGDEKVKMKNRSAYFSKIITRISTGEERMIKGKPVKREKG